MLSGQVTQNLFVTYITETAREYAEKVNYRPYTGNDLYLNHY
jgi:hypothetical protein